MINFYTHPKVLLAGMMSIFTTGCITGTHTFSNAATPTTTYCSIEQTPAQMFDNFSAVENSNVLSSAEMVCLNERKVSLNP